MRMRRDAVCCSPKAPELRRRSNLVLLTWDDGAGAAAVGVPVSYSVEHTSWSVQSNASGTRTTEDGRGAVEVAGGQPQQVVADTANHARPEAAHLLPSTAKTQPLRTARRERATGLRARVMRASVMLRA